MTGHMSHWPAEGDLTCAERIRRERLGDLPSADDADPDLLYAVACDISASCGHCLFKAHRLARGWTVPRAVEAFHAMCRREGIKPRGLVARSWMEWEAGGRPNFDYQDLLSRLFHANSVQLGWAADYSTAKALPALAATHLPSSPVDVRADGRSQRAIQHLPADIADFTGRREQAELLVRVLTGGDVTSETAMPIAVISGKPGAGKSALALHVAHRVSGKYPDGQLYAALRGAGSRPVLTAETLAGLLRELGVDNSDIPDQTADRARMYRAQLADGRFLVVLDDAADEAQVRDLLPGSPRCAVVVTSRSRLHVLAGAQPVPLDVMPATQARELLEAIVGAERVEAEPDAYTAIAALCGYLPLALRIAGARLRSWPTGNAARFADRLRDERHRLDLLKADDLEVRASFTLSYANTRPEAQRAFRLSALLSHNFAAWNLAVLLGGNIGTAEAEELLDELADAQLIEADSVDATGVLRYQLHDLLRDFAREMLHQQHSAEERSHALACLADEYALAARAATGLLQPGSPICGSEPRLISHVVHDDPQNWISAERLTLVALVQQAHAAGLWEAAWRLADSLPAD